MRKESGGPVAISEAEHKLNYQETTSLLYLA